MDRQPSISVIVPAYNSAVSLGRCLTSILSQTLRPQQIILVNDGSTDSTEEVARTYQSEITYLTQPNQGASAARNTGLEIASSELLTFLDADDYWLPTFLESCVEFVTAHPEVVAVSVGQRIIGWRGKEQISPAVIAARTAKFSEPRVVGDFFSFWAQHDHIRTGSVVIRQSVIQEAGYLRPELRTGEDLEYWGYLATFGPWGFIPKVLLMIDGTATTAAQGWIEKHRARWSLAPDVSLWQERILPRLQPPDWAGFTIVRGRLAQGSAHDNVLAGQYQRALSVVREYGDSFPPGHVSRVLLLGARTGQVGWRIACWLLRLRELFKALIIRMRK